MNDELKKEFLELNNEKTYNSRKLKIDRGLKFETLIYKVFKGEGVSITKGYHTSDNRAEQIDGALEIGGRIFLLEVKWVESGIAASELYAFIGKVENKFHGTLGIFISRKELSSNFVNALSKGRRQSVIVIHGKDVDNLFKHGVGVSLKDFISHTLKVLSYDNVNHFSVSDYIDTLKPEEEMPDDTAKIKAKEFIIKYLSESMPEVGEMLFAFTEHTSETLSFVFKFAVLNFVNDALTFKFIGPSLRESATHFPFNRSPTRS